MDKVLNDCNQSLSSEELVEKHTILVKRIAHHLLARLPPNILVDDLIQAGMLGLLEAAKNFNSTKGASFETFAGIRIRGSMLDDIRKGDWTPRSVHKNSRAITQAISSVENEMNSDAKDSDIAKRLGIELPQYHKMLNEVNRGKLVGIEYLGISEDVIATPDFKSTNTPYDELVHGCFQKALAKAIVSLPEREAIVLSLYYDEDLSLREIGQALNVSESRVSQIHSQAKSKLKIKLSSWQQELA